MPQEKIIIKFKPEGHEDLINAINRLNAATKDFKNQTLKAQKELKAFETRNKRNTDETKRGAQAFSTIRSKLLLFNFAMGLGIAQLIKFTNQAAKLQDVRRAFDTLQGGVGKGAIAIDKLKKATDDTMSSFDLFQQANNAMILGVTKNSDVMAEMFDIAQRLGQALGRDTKESVESLITGIGRQSRMMLDNIGIIVKSDEAYKAYAKELGITVEQLTEAERKTAFLQATMEAAREKVAGLSEEQLSNSQELQKMKVAAIEAAAALGEALMPIVIPLAKGLTLLAKGAQIVFEAFDPSKLGITFSETVNELGFLKDMLKATEKTMKDLGAEQMEFQGVDLGLGFKNVTTELQPLIAQYQEYRDRIGQLEEELRNLFGSEEEGIVLIEREISARQGLLGVLDEEDQKRLETAQAALAIGGEMLGQFNDMTSAMSAGVNARMKNEMDALKATSAYQRADGDKRKAMEKGVTDSYAQERTRLAKFEKASNLAQAGINIATAITKVLPNVILASLVAAMGAVQIGAILDTPIPKFAQGGMIGGRRHSAGGTMINAEAGEFIMSRSAVQSVGIENLNRMNEGGGGGSVTVNVSGNVLTQDFVEGELAENIKEAIRRGTDFGIS